MCLCDSVCLCVCVLGFLREIQLWWSWRLWKQLLWLMKTALYMGWFYTSKDPLELRNIVDCIKDATSQKEKKYLIVIITAAKMTTSHLFLSFPFFSIFLFYFFLPFPFFLSFSPFWAFSSMPFFLSYLISACPSFYFFKKKTLNKLKQKQQLRNISGRELLIHILPLKIIKG